MTDDELVEAMWLAWAEHAFNDPAWLALGDDELVRRIESLPGGV